MAREFMHAVDDMLEAIEGVQQTIAGKTFEEYVAQWVLRHAVQRGIEIISEASRSIPTEIQDFRPEIPWPKVRAIGNLLRHEYHGLSDRIIWTLVVDEIPKLRTAVEAIRHQFQKDSP